MIAQVALTVICIVPATGISVEVLRDYAIRSRFPAAQYLAVEISIDRDAPARESEERRQGVPGDAETSASASADRVEQIYGELERRITEEPGVLAIAFGDLLPGMIAPARRAEVEVSPGADPILVPDLWTAAVGPGYFEMFDRPILSGRDFHGGDLAAGARSVVVNEAFARQHTKGGSPVGRRVRFAGSGTPQPGPWFEIIGMVRDIGMTPTGSGEAPHVYRAASPATTSPLMMGVRLASDPSALVRRVREIAVEVDPNVRLGTVQPLDEVVWSRDARSFAVSGGIVGVVSLGLFLSAAGIFSLMSVTVARRTREIGLRVALGASPGRVLAGIFSRALLLIGSGIVAGNSVIVLLAIALEDRWSVAWVARALLITSSVMLTVGLLGCVEPARRALRINPTEALKEA
ncbi:MAG: ABC transporter permease, partial [Steroidobacteraceae bacterium]